MHFQISDNTFHARGNPWAYNVVAPWVENEFPCAGCGFRHGEYRGPAQAYLEGGAKWPDVLGVGSTGPELLFSRRVIDTWKTQTNAELEVFPVKIAEIKSKKLSATAAPDYFYINVQGRMQIDLEKSGIKFSRLCPICHCTTHRSPQPDHFVPIPESWDGSDLFRLYDFPRMLFGTMKVLLLARELRWTNFSFVPLDAKRRHLAGWKGIDYLGKKWPPEYYPVSPSAGQTAMGWVQDYLSEDENKIAKAYQALSDLGTAGDEDLLLLLSHADERVRKTAATFLSGFPHKTPELKARIKEIL